MTVKLHKVTVFVVDSGMGDGDDGLAQLQGDMAHNSGSRITEIQTAEFDREWSDDDLLNKTTTMDDTALLESLVSIDGMGISLSLPGQAEVKFLRVELKQDGYVACFYDNGKEIRFDKRNLLLRINNLEKSDKNASEEVLGLRAIKKAEGNG